ncbi:metal cation symporter ZIP14-like [Argiope bruennichi]|uniref:metal cation symporter ZIP14-like n=1 Tax=Argiope bruennichi TaxID=94029 RepID=UPI00249516D8|nr:metal cation symporter ZIP14-like [Argiope bruennichi]XP_055945183.1 metal cation symporter ZIP14-like [Argiope bruennichi]XP_055945184.1 metal cation symporter ZIP14-like [Argiope bruennichi]
MAIHWRTTFLIASFILPFYFCNAEQQFIDSLDILESLSQIALLRHHPTSAYSNANISESFSLLFEDLHNQNLTYALPNLNCSSLSQFPLLPKNLCNDGHLLKCMSASDMLELVPQSTKTVSEALARLCPLLLLQLHNSACSVPVSDQITSLKPSSLAVWGYGLLFVTVISCCSLVGVIILPLLSKNVYQVVLMLFEGLAVGSLVGSSLFHLIPQTFKLVGQDEEHNYLWKSLLIFGGIYLFYLSERFMKIIIDVKKERKLKKSGYQIKENSNEFLKTLPETNHTIIVTSVKEEKNENGNYTNGSLPILTAESFNNQNNYKINDATTEHMIVKSYPVEAEIANSHHTHHHEHTIHFEKGKSTIATVAWMIIFGDGLHNFIDGLSIGAAFSESILAGVSISVAVICEEFPHELGDFAVLLGAGMTMRQALLYNFLSAITCYLGLVLGIILGDLAEGAPFIFALAAGMFLYIALVDMMGELGEVLEEARQKGIKQQLKVFFIQNIGIILGVAILFVMARYQEHFNFENLSTFASSQEETIDDRVKQLYSGLQEAKNLQSVLTN